MALALLVTARKETICARRRGTKAAMEALIASTCSKDPSTGLIKLV